MHLRDMLMPGASAELIYNGYWFSPKWTFYFPLCAKGAEAIDGTKSRCRCIKGNVLSIDGNRQPRCTIKTFSSMDIEGGFKQEDSRGFININAVRAQGPQCGAERKDALYLWRKEKE